MSAPFGNAALALDLLLPEVKRQPNGLKVVTFAGGGGSCEGIEQALAEMGDPHPYVDVAINHDAEAVAMHRANHSHTRHYCQNVWQVKPMQIIEDFGSRPIDMLWASPDCKHFSKAKGGKPVEKNIRDLAWVVLAYARLPKHLRPLEIYLENVEEFRDWSPERQRRWPNGKPMFDLHGAPVMEPHPDKKGKTFDKWVHEHRKLGYVMKMQERRASLDGTPTIRKRLYIVMKCDGRAIEFTKGTHGDKPGQLPVRTAAECIDFTRRCPSIFIGKRDAKKLKIKRPLARNTLRRVARGIDRYVLRHAEPFLVPITHHGDERVHSIHEGLRTQTAAPRGEHALVQPFVAGLAHGEHTERPGGRSHLPDEPLRTIHAGGGNHAVIAPVVTNYKGDSIGSSANAGMPTVTANSFIKRPGGAAPLALTAPVLVKNMTNNAAHSPADPLSTSLTGNHHILTSPVLAGCGGRAAQSPPKSANAPLNTMTAKADQILVAPTLIQTGYGEREGQEPRSLDLGRPLGTAVGGGVKHAVVATYLAQHNTDMVGHDAREPVSTIVQKGCTQAVVSSHLINMKGSDRRGGPVTAPAPTQCAGGWHVGEVRAFMVNYHRDGGQFSGLADPMPTSGAKRQLAIVTCETIPAPELTDEERAGALRVVRFLQKFGVLPKDSDATMVLVKGMPMVDIGMRMLEPRELFNAQGFPVEYIIDRGLFVIDGKQVWRVLTKTAQIRMCGNSVCPPVARALILANHHIPANDNREIAAEAV